MAANKKLLLLPGDGIGPEVIAEVRRVVDWMGQRRSVRFDVKEGLIGGAAIDATGHPLPDETLSAAKNSAAILLGAVGGPNLRPALVFDALASASTLKEEVVRGLDIMIVRELTGGIYFGEPRGIEDKPDGTRKGVNTLTYTSPEVHRIGRTAFDLAQKRNKRVCSIDKANVLETTVMWREEMELIKSEFPDVELSHMYVDNAAMQLVRYPKQFDVVVTTNMFGDILSDCAAMLTGSLGMLPSASLGEADPSGRCPALYEPVHGSAPDIAGQGIANPLATILSFSMLLRYSFDIDEDADMIEQAVKNVLDSGMRTEDIMETGRTKVSTGEMGEAVLKELDKLVA